MSQLLSLSKSLFTLAMDNMLSVISSRIDVPSAAVKRSMLHSIFFYYIICINEKEQWTKD